MTLPDWARKGLWFVGIWVASVATLTIVAMVIKTVL